MLLGVPRDVSGGFYNLAWGPQCYSRVPSTEESLMLLGGPQCCLGLPSATRGVPSVAWGSLVLPVGLYCFSGVPSAAQMPLMLLGIPSAAGVSPGLLGVPIFTPRCLSAGSDARGAPDLLRHGHTVSPGPLGGGQQGAAATAARRGLWVPAGDSCPNTDAVPIVGPCRVSSVLNRDVKHFGKKHMFDASEETCWNSDQVWG